MRKKAVYTFIFGTYVLIVIILFLVSGFSSPPRDLLTLATFLFEIIIFPATIFSLAITAENLRKSTETPLLHLEWDNKLRTKKTRVSLFDKINNQPKKTFPVYLYNRGDNIAVWYSVSLEIPKQVYGYDDQITLDNALEFNFGNENNWHIDIYDSYYKLTFQSNGQQASYPYERNRLVSIKIPNANNLHSKRNEISIPYYINTDKGLSRKSYLYIDV